MKKLVVSLAAGLILAGTAATSASAASYQVEKGDTLWGIAQNNQTSVEKLKELNSLNSDIIYPGQSLEIDGQTQTQPASYTVKKGDTLYSIGQEFGVSVSDLKAWNALGSDIILPAQQLHLQPTENVDVLPEQVEEKPVKEEAKQAEPTETPQPEENTTEPTVEQSASAPAPEEASGKEVTVTATAYTAGCEGCSGITYTGINLNENPNAKVIAVDPNIIPLGSRVHVEGYGEAIAGDIGGAIQGNRIDLHVPTKEEAYDWGTRTVDVTILD
ncbi:LysM peptidoglycan-binding and 3D domain-containing protein [Sediminibacillus massiliensis]|uniref:LysM peptidoglycan-binding and 3D domain-containing protein n=1 Tax=Sediminibacillus massiliensis TaxID=1926277 RepID=UPI0009889108|nr:3D domain-containing protein [Sediminibacillus massiliensis]